MLSEILIVFIKEVCIIKGACINPLFFGGRGPVTGTVYIIIPVPSDSVSRSDPGFHVRENDLYAPAYTTHAHYRYVV